ncbi:MAG: response regulator [Gemmatimonadaceae bacterium]
MLRGAYVVLSVTNTGVGMDDETMERAFEPFYTTKGPEKGTGLGLSTVHGIVAQSGGGISVTSTAGRGTTFEVFLPQLSAAEDSRSTSGFPTFKRGTETILVAEDNGALRRLACRILRSAGYTVREAATGEEALELLASLPGQVHLLLTDVVMPRINGGAPRRCQELRPMTRILFMSGHTDDALVLKGIFESDLAFVGKPYTAAELTAKVREVLDA